MRKLAFLIFQTPDGVMQAPSVPDEDLSGGFTREGWANECWSEVMEQDGPLLQIHGSWQLIQTLLTYKLIDEFRLWTFPVVVGAGKRLFAEGLVPSNLKLTKIEFCPSGAFMNFYQLV